MNESTIVLLVCLAVIALMSILIYAANRNRTLCEVRRGIDQILAGNLRIEESLRQHRHVLNDAHKQIHAVSKVLE